MDKLSFSDIISLLTFVSIVIGMFVGLGTIRQRNDAKAAEQAEMRVDIKYIKDKIDGIDTMREDLIDLKASCKSAHKRLDEHFSREHGQHSRRGDSNE